MDKIIFECELITPMFMYGGDGKTLELRPSEFKGMLRFWWRALHPELSLSELKKKEGEIFGDTNEKSNFRIKVKPFEEKKDINRNLKNSNTIGINYLFYSMFLGNNKEKHHFLPEIKFEVTFIFQKNEYIKEVLKSFWLLSYLGGLGSRNRRGAGNFKIIGIKDEKNLLEKINFKFLIEDIDSFKNFLRFILPIDTKEISYINLGNFSLYVYTEQFRSWKDALNNVGIDLQNFRKKRNPDYSTVKSFILNGKIGKVERPAFGLPLEFRYRSLNGKSAKLEGSNKERQRSGSPLFIKILKFDNVYVPVLIFCQKELLPKGDKIKISSKNQSKNKFLDVPDLSIISDFLNSLINSGKIEEVHLNGKNGK